MVEGVMSIGSDAGAEAMPAEVEGRIGRALWLPGLSVSEKNEFRRIDSMADAICGDSGNDNYGKCCMERCRYAET